MQIQDGGTFDPTKNGFSSVSFGGRFGRTARIELDGIDISDETVGTTTQNLPLDAIEEASLQQSSLDLSTELTSSGSVNMITKSGTNDSTAMRFTISATSAQCRAARRLHQSLSEKSVWWQRGWSHHQRQAFLFRYRRTQQARFARSCHTRRSLRGPHRKLQLAVPRDPGRWPPGLHTGRFKIFYRFTFDQNSSVLPFIPNSFQPFANVNHDRDHVVGVDFNTGKFTHSIRFGYTKFQNGITDAVAGSSIFNPAPGIELAIGDDPNCLTAGLDPFLFRPEFSGPSGHHAVEPSNQV